MKEVEKEIIKLDLNCKCDYNYNCINKMMFILKEGYYIKDIESKLKPGEKLTFMPNSEDSIYWKHSLGDGVRIDSDKGSIRDWANELQK